MCPSVFSATFGEKILTSKIIVYNTDHLKYIHIILNFFSKVFGSFVIFQKLLDRHMWDEGELGTHT